MRPLTALFAALLFLLPALGLSAHPHMFIDSSITFDLSEEGLEGFWIEWGFDEVFTAMISQDYDRDGNGSFSDTEQRAIRNGAFANLANYGYFTYILRGPEIVQPERVESFSAWLDDGRLYYRFYVPYEIEAGGTEHTVRVAIYDRTFYCDIATRSSSPVEIEAPESLRTSFEVEKNRDLEINYSPAGGRRREGQSYTGVAYPDQVRLSFRKKSD